MTLYTHSGGTWQTVDSPDFKVKQGGSWSPVATGYVKVAGVWQTFYQQSDPVTYTFNPVSMRGSTGFSSSWVTSGFKVGSWGFGDRVSYLDFTTAVDSASGLTLAGALAVRPVPSAGSLATYRDVSGYGTINSGTWYISWNNGGYGSGTGTNEAGGRVSASLVGASWGAPASTTFTGLDGLANSLASNTMSITNNLTPVTSGGGEDLTYATLSNTLSNHTLTVTLDYV